MYRYLYQWFLVLVAIFWGGTLLAQSPSNPVLLTMENPGYEEKPKWFKQSFLDIREDIAQAASENKRVMLYFYQDGCPYCKKLLEDNYGNREIAKFAQEKFDTIAINMWGDREVVDLQGQAVSEKVFAKNLRVLFTPTMLMLDERGQTALRINGYYHPDKFMAALNYVAEKRESTTRFLDYYTKQPSKKALGKLHRQDDFIQPPYDLRAKQRSINKPLMVMFEQKVCLTCDELHLDILQREESKKQLSKLDVVLLDIWSKTPVTTPDNRQLTARDWAKELGIQNSPSLVFFDQQGKEIFRADAYLKAFHIQGVMDYISSGSYKGQPDFQRWLSAKANQLEAQGIHVDLWK